MKKSILTLGNVLLKEEQKLINGGSIPPYCGDSNMCPSGFVCMGFACFRR